VFGQFSGPSSVAVSPNGVAFVTSSLYMQATVCGDCIIAERTDPKIEGTAKSELRRFEEIQASDRDDRSKCGLILGLIEHRCDHD